MMKGKTRKEKKRLIVISLTIVLLLISLFYTVYDNFMQVVQNKKSITFLTSEYEQLLDEQTRLSSQVLKMQDPEYVARYAKEKFLYSLPDEIIIRVDNN